MNRSTIDWRNYTSTLGLAILMQSRLSALLAAAHAGDADAVIASAAELREMAVALVSDFGPDVFASLRSAPDWEDALRHTAALLGYERAGAPDFGEVDFVPLAERARALGPKPPLIALVRKPGSVELEASEVVTTFVCARCGRVTPIDGLRAGPEDEPHCERCRDLTRALSCPACGGTSWGGGTDNNPRPWCNGCGEDQPGWECKEGS